MKFQITTFIISFFGVIFFSCSSLDSKKEQSLFSSADSLLTLEAIAGKANSDSLYYEASLLAARILDTEKAIRYIDSAMKINPKNPHYFFLKGYYLYSLGHFSEASLYFQKSLEMDSLNPKTLFYYGGSLLALNEYSKSLQYFQKAIILDPFNSDYLFSYGLALYKIGKIEAAKNYFLTAVQIDSFHTKSIYLLIDSYFKINRPDSAEIWIHKLLQHDPAHPIGRFQLGNLERDKALQAIQEKNPTLAKKYLKNALQHYSYALEADSSFAEAYYRRGYTFFELGQYQEALRDFQKAVHHNPSDYRAYFMIGSIYEYYGEKKEAIKFYRKSLQLNPDFEDAQKAIFDLAHQNLE